MIKHGNLRERLKLQRALRNEVQQFWQMVLYIQLYLRYRQPRNIKQFIEKNKKGKNESVNAEVLLI